MRLNICQGCAKEFYSHYKRGHCPGECTRAHERAVTLKVWRNASAERSRADRLVDTAIDDGILVPQPCEVCGTENHVVAHHDDYARPLAVRWLCRSHHKIHHNQHGPGRNA